MPGLFMLAQKILERYREDDQEEWSDASWLALIQHRYNLSGRFNRENDTTSSTIYLVMEYRHPAQQEESSLSRERGILLR